MSADFPQPEWDASFPQGVESWESYIHSLEKQLLDSGKGLAKEVLPHPDWPFPKWDRYEFQAFLGQGAMGLVFKVYDPTLNRYVAFKVLRKEAQIHAHRFLAEARAQAKVNHPHVAKVHEVGEANGCPYLTMQLLEGHTLQSVREKLTLEERVEVIRQACEGVHAAHRMGLLHRDLKPANMVVERDLEGRLQVYVVDFGMACEAATEGHSEEEVMGTPAFMSPEQAAGQPLDKRSDVFSLGTSLYAALTGKSPFGGQSILSTLGKVALSQPDSLQSQDTVVARDLEAVIRRAMEKNPDKRYPSARALGLDLQRWLDGEPVEAMARRPLYLLGRWVRKNRALALAGLLLVTTLTGTGLWAIRSNWRSKAQAKYYQFFGQEAEQMEAMMALAETMPLHDTFPERRSIEERMGHLEKMILQFGAPAEAPGLYALGRGHLALGNWPEAHAKLGRAWHLGLQTPEAAFALGTCLVHLVREELQDVVGPQRAEKKKELDLKYGPSIKYYLSQARSSSKTVMVALAKAQMLNIEGRFQEAVDKVDEILKVQPWNVQALLFKARIYFERDLNQPALDDPFRQAKENIALARNIARSCASVYELDAGIRASEFHRKLFQQQDLTPYFNSLMEITGELRRVNSKSPLPYSMEAIANYYLSLRTAGPAALEIIQKAVKNADRAITIMPSSPRIYNIKGLALCRLAELQLFQAIDPTKAINDAIATFTQGIGFRAFSDHLNANLGLAYFFKGNYELASNQNPWASFENSIKYFKKAIDIKPSWQFHYNMALVHHYMGLFQWRQGKDFQHEFDHALHIVQDEVNQGKVPVRFEDNILLAELHLKSAELSFWRGQVDWKVFAQGREYLERALKILPDYAAARSYRAWAIFFEALSGAGSPDLGTARREMQQALTPLPFHPEYLYYEGWLHLAVFRRAPSWKAYLALEKHLEKTVALPMSLAENRFLAAEACRIGWEKKAPGAPSERWLMRMRSQMEQAKRQNPWIGPAADAWLARVQKGSIK